MIFIFIASSQPVIPGSRYARPIAQLRNGE
jgi:hypothetical protein